MDAASPYYNYQVTTKCGVPVIRLDGTPEDWAKLNTLVFDLAEMFEKDELLTAYLNRLIPITTQLALEANETIIPQVSFWREIYKYMNGSGGSTASGWIMAFMAFRWNARGKPEARDMDWDGDFNPHATWRDLGGMSTNMFPSHVSSVPFNWKYFGEDIPMHFAGGVLSVTDDEGFMTPRLSYAVLED